MKSFLLLVFIVGAFAQTFTFKSNVTLSNANEFSFRVSTTTVLSTLIYPAMFISSVSVGVNSNSASFDGLYGAAYTSILYPPSAFLSFFYSASSWAPTGFTFGNASVSAGFIGQSFISLDEVDSTGALKATTPLKSLIWGYSSSDSSSGAGGLRYLTTTATKGTMTIKISFIYSDVVGVLNVIGTAVVTPKSLESVINIQNYPYADNGNSLRLNLGVGTAAGSASVQGQVTHLSSGNGQTGTFLTLDHVASINGASTPVSISAFTDGQGQADFGNGLLQGQITEKYGAGASFKFVTVTFPAGAANIIYDPSIGAGANPPTSSGVKNVASFFALIIAFAMFLF